MFKKLFYSFFVILFVPIFIANGMDKKEENLDSLSPALQISSALFCNLKVSNLLCQELYPNKEWISEKSIESLNSEFLKLVKVEYQNTLQKLPSDLESKKALLKEKEKNWQNLIRSLKENIRKIEDKSEEQKFMDLLVQFLRTHQPLTKKKN